MSDFFKAFQVKSWWTGRISHPSLRHTERKVRSSRTSRWSWFHNIAASWLRQNKEDNQRVWCSCSWQPAAHVFKMLRKFLGSSATFEPWFCPRSKGQSQRLCLWCENVQFLRWGLQSGSKKKGLASQACDSNQHRNLVLNVITRIIFIQQLNKTRSKGSLAERVALL